MYLVYYIDDINLIFLLFIIYMKYNFFLLLFNKKSINIKTTIFKKIY